MKRSTLFVVIAALLLDGISSPLCGGDLAKQGTMGGQELLLPDGAAGTALGSASMAFTSGVEAISWNPAGLPSFRGSVDALFAHTNYIADSRFDYGAAAFTVEQVATFALSVKVLSFGEIPVTTDDFPSGTGETFSPGFTVFGLSVGRVLTERLSVGATGKLIRESIANTSATGVACDVGMQYGFGGTSALQGLRVGVAVKNVGTTMRYAGPGLSHDVVVPQAPAGSPPVAMEITAAEFEIPSSLEIGLSYDLPIGDWSRCTAMSMFENAGYGPDQYRFGIEYAFEESFFLRGGYVTASGSGISAVSAFSGPTAGAGFSVAVANAVVALDYAYRQTDVFKGTNTLALRITI